MRGAVWKLCLGQCFRASADTKSSTTFVQVPAATLVSQNGLRSRCLCGLQGFHVREQPPPCPWPGCPPAPCHLSLTGQLPKAAHPGLERCTQEPGLQKPMCDLATSAASENPTAQGGAATGLRWGSSRLSPLRSRIPFYQQRSKSNYLWPLVVRDCCMSGSVLL